MAITSYKIDSVIKAYSKQERMNRSTFHNPLTSSLTDAVTLSNNDSKQEAYEKITYTLLDIILTNNQAK